MKTQTIGTIVQRVISQYNKGAQSDESRLTPRHVYHVIISNRSTLLEQQAKKKQRINQLNYQTIVIDLEEVNIAEFANLPITLGKTVYKSVKPLPRVLSNMDKLLIQTVSSLDNTISFNESSIDKIKYSSGNRYAKKGNQFYLENDFIIVPCNIIGLTKLKIVAVFEDPLEAQLYNSTDKCKSAFDYDFFMDKGIETTVIDLSSQELIERFNSNFEDVSNNSRDSVLETSK